MTLHLREPVEVIANREPVFVAADETLRGVAHRLWLESVGVLVVGDADRPLGVISERDVVAQLAQGADPDVVTAGEAMTKYLIAVRPDDPTLDAASTMVDDLIRHVPVVDEVGTVVGMVSMRDVMRPLLLDALGG